MGAQRKTAEPTVVNGINVDDMFALIDDVKREPAKGKTNWHVTTTWQGQARCHADILGRRLKDCWERPKRVPTGSRRIRARALLSLVFLLGCADDPLDDTRRSPS